MSTKTTRRAIVAGIAAAPLAGLPAAAGSVSVLSAAFAAQSTLHELIDAHRRAFIAFEEICGPESNTSKDSPEYPAILAEWERRNKAEEVALDAVCSYSSKTLDEARIKAEYLTKHLVGSELTAWQHRAVLASFAANEPAAQYAIAAPASAALAQAIETHKKTRAAINAHTGDEDLPDGLDKAENDALEVIARLPCVTDAELLEKLRYLFNSEKSLWGAPTTHQEFGLVSIALDHHFGLEA